MPKLKQLKLTTTQKKVKKKPKMEKKVKKKPKMVKKTSIYEDIARAEELRREADLIWRICMNEDTTELDSILESFRQKDINTYGNQLSDLFKYEVKGYIDSKDNQNYKRVGKHGYFFLMLYLNPEYAKSLLEPEPLVNPRKFRIFYKKNLPEACTMLFQTHCVTMQAFVEKVRSDYFFL